MYPIAYNPPIIMLTKKQTDLYNEAFNEAGFVGTIWYGKLYPVLPFKTHRKYKYLKQRIIKCSTNEKYSAMAVCRIVLAKDKYDKRNLDTIQHRANN